MDKNNYKEEKKLRKQMNRQQKCLLKVRQIQIVLKIFSSKNGVEKHKKLN